MGLQPGVQSGEPCLIAVPLTLPGYEPLVPVPISSDDPLFQKWFGMFKRECEKP